MTNISQQFQVVGTSTPFSVESHLQEGVSFVHSSVLGNTISGHAVIDGNMVPFVAAREGNRLFLWLQGTTLTLEAITPQSKRASGKGRNTSASGELKAPMPGTVLVVHVKPGDIVESGQAIVVMESMKMELTITAPWTGCVKQVSCEPQTMVEMGATLAQLTPLEISNEA